MQENIDIVHGIAVVLNVPYETIIEECQEICATRLVKASKTLEQIYHKALGDMTMAEIRQDLINKVDSEDYQ